MPITLSPRKRADLIRELQAKRNSCALHNMTFINHDLKNCVPLTEPQRIALEQVQHEHFLRWWDSWIAPLLDELGATNPDTGNN